MNNSAIKEGLQGTRLIMVLSSMAPLFILWAIRGTKSLDDEVFVPICLLLASCPTLVLLLRIWMAKTRNDCQTKAIGLADDHRDHILVYLFATLLPFYTVNLEAGREFAASVGALLFILFLFWHLNMHYMNILFAIKGYRVFTVTPKSDNRHNSGAPFVLLTKRQYLTEGQVLDVYRLSDLVFLEK
jgi:hypothetical protein